MVDEFYDSFWRSDSWGQRKINRDEQARLQVIASLIEEFVRPRLETENPFRILDVGCGRGWLTNELKKYGTVLGIDPIAAATKRAQELFPDCEFLCNDTRGLLELKGSSVFDLAVSSEVIEHVPDESKVAFLSSIFEILAPGGFEGRAGG